MYRLLTSAAPYGTGSFYSSAWQSSAHANFYGETGDYLNRFYQKSIENLLIILVQQQIQELVAGQNNDSEEGTSDQNNNDANNTTSTPQCGCPCHTSPEPVTEPLIQPRTSLYDEILHSIQNLSQFIENNKVMQSSKNYNDYISHSTRDQNTIRHIYQNGGRVISQHDDHILAEDAQKNRYIVTRY